MQSREKTNGKKNTKLYPPQNLRLLRFLKNPSSSIKIPYKDLISQDFHVQVQLNRTLFCELHGHNLVWLCI